MHRKFLLHFIFIFLSLSAKSQVTFLKIFGEGTYCPYGNANADGDYVCTVDSVGAVNYLFNGYGVPQWQKNIPLNGDVIPSSITTDENGDFVFAGTLIDSTGTANALIARLDSNGDTINYKLFPPATDGNYGVIAYPTMDSDYVFDVYEDGPLASNSSTLYKLDIGFNILWSAPTGSSGLTTSAILQDRDSNFVFTHYDQAGLTGIQLEKYNNNGVQVISKTISDTACACFNSTCVISSKLGGYVFGTEHQNKTLLFRLDDNFDTIWTKQLNWGNNSPVSIARDRDEGFFVLLNYQGKATMHHFDINGDSIATFQFNPMLLTVGSRMERCPDGGFLIAGTTYDYFNTSHGFLLKIDSLCRFVPQGHILTSGPNVFCQGDSITLTGPNGNYHFNWSNGDTTQATVVYTTGTYYLTITSMSGIQATLVPENIWVSNPPTPTIINHITHLEASTVGSYQWYFNGVMIPGATHDTLVTTQTGNFNVVVTDSTGCIKISPVFYYSWSGLQTLSEKLFDVYPVPASEYIRVIGDFRNESILILDSDSRLVKEIEKFSSNELIDLSELQNGIYFLKMKNSSVLKKFVVIK